ncbi:MAG: peptide ABC transporter substrate-binding protein [Candidatus Baltobacteraceae bacterium]
MIGRRIVALLLLIGPAACSQVQTGTGAGGRHPWTQPEVLRVAVWANPNTLNPLLSSTTNDAFLSSLAFDQLVMIDPKGNDVPRLARVVPTPQNGGISKDGLSITYHLRPNIKWQDGVAFSSKDVKFSWQAIMNPNNNVVTRRGYDVVKFVDTPDADTVVFHLKKPFAPFVDTVFGESDSPYGVVPEHLLAKYPNLNQIPFNSLPIGTGAFRVAEWVRGDHITYVANDAYYLGAPRLRKIIVRIVTDDNTREAQLRAHEIDFANDISSPIVHDLRSVSDVRLILTPSPAYESIDFNLQRPPLNELSVRQAITYAIDTARIIHTVEFDTADRATADLATNSWGYNAALNPYPFDPAKARQVLDQAGWRVGANGIRVKNGTPLSVQLVYGQGNPTGERIGVIVQAALQSIGMQVQLKTYNYTVLYAQAQDGGILNGGKFDMALYAWVSGADPDNSSQWTCDFIPPAGNNVSRYCNRQFDAIEKHALTTFDRASRKSDYAKIEATLARDLPADFMFYPKRRYAVNPDLKNFDPNGISEGWNAYLWSI